MNAGAPTAMDKACVAVFCGNSASAARTVAANVPGVVGLPVSVPAASSVNPGGIVPPASDHVYEPLPPDAASAAEYAAPTAASASDAVVIVSGGAGDSGGPGLGESVTSPASARVACARTMSMSAPRLLLFVPAPPYGLLPAR